MLIYARNVALKPQPITERLLEMEIISTLEEMVYYKKLANKFNSFQCLLEAKKLHNHYKELADTERGQAIINRLNLEANF